MNIQETLFETETPQLLIHGVVGSCLDASNAKVRDFTIRKVDYKTCVSFCQIWHYSKKLPCWKGLFWTFLWRKYYRGYLLWRTCNEKPKGNATMQI